MSMGWQDVLKQRKRPLLGRPPLCLSTFSLFTADAANNKLGDG